MGKRELLIVVAFVTIGVVAYQLTARPATGARGFSLGRLVDNVRRDIRGNRATASVITTGHVSDIGGLTEVRVANAADVTIMGDDGADIRYELVVDASGPDERTAHDSAARAAVAQDRLGGALLLRVAAQRNLRQVAHLALHVPARFGVHVEGAPAGTRVNADHVSALHLDGVVGDSRATRITGAVTGTHRNGALVLSDADSVDLTLVSSRATIDRVHTSLNLVARNGRVEISDTLAAIDLDATSEDVTIASSSGRIHVSGTSGRLHVQDTTGPVVLDMHRTPIDVVVPRVASVTASTSDAPIAVTMAAAVAAGAAIDAVSTEGGTVDAGDLGLSATTTDTDSRVRRTAARSGATLALRNQRAAIVIARMK